MTFSRIAQRTIRTKTSIILHSKHHLCINNPWKDLRTRPIQSYKLAVRNPGSCTDQNNRNTNAQLIRHIIHKQNSTPLHANTLKTLLWLHSSQSFSLTTNQIKLNSDQCHPQTLFEGPTNDSPMFAETLAQSQKWTYPHLSHHYHCRLSIFRISTIKYWTYHQSRTHKPCLHTLGHYSPRYFTFKHLNQWK